IERMTERLRLRHRSAHLLCPGLEFDANPFAVHRMFVPVPGETLDTDLRDVAAEAAVAVDQAGTRASARGSKRRRKTARAATDDEHVGFQDDVDRSGRFRNLFHFR